ncbi:MAG: NAD-dependent epimerase/dehydratase family protein [Sphingobacteriaceae bacterium]|nr:NAD-dependent epimerase/dehydratase family protein [Sphingobacteriaceae bacterium]
MTTNSIIKEDLETIYNSDVDWSKFQNTVVLITGANGFLPAYLVESLLYLNFIDPKNNVKVICLVRNIENAESRFIDYKQCTNLEFIVQDVSDSIKLTEKVDYIIHAASQASPKFYGTDPVGTLKANVLGTMNLLNYAKENKIKSFLYFSSGEVYGELDSEHIPIKENTFGYINPTNVRSCYAESKRMGENICVSYHHQYGVSVKIVRPFHTYGPKMKLDDGRVYADFVSDILNEKDICMHSDGSATRAFCYLTDATVGFLKILLDGKNGEAYNVGNPNEEHSILELAETLVNLYPEKGLKVIKQLNKEDNNYLKSPLKRNSPNISKINELNWHPLVSIKDGFKRTIQSYVSGI